MSASAEFMQELEQAQATTIRLASFPRKVLEAQDNALGQRLRRGRFKLSLAERETLERERANIKMALVHKTLAQVQP